MPSERKRFPHQVEAAKFAAERGSAGFWMGMRTGKTLACLDTVAQLPGPLPVLIICPVSVMRTWQNELLLEGWSRDDVALVRNGTRGQLRARLIRPRPRWVIINFEMVRAIDAVHIRRVTGIKDATGSLISRDLPKALEIRDWATVIIDESYRISNDESKTVEYLLRFPKPQNQHRFLLSGAPVSEGPLDLVSQHLFMDGHYFGCATVAEYLGRYWEWNKWGNEWRLQRWCKRSHLEDVRQYLHRTGYCCTMQDLGLGAVRFYEFREVEMNAAQLQLWAWVKLATTYVHPKTGNTVEMIPIVRATFAQKISSGIHPLTNEIVSEEKIQDIREMLKDRPEPVLVLSRFTAPLHRLLQRLQEDGLRVALIDGNTPDAERERIRQAFQGERRVGDQVEAVEPTLDAVLAQVRTVKMGLDFSRLARILYLSNSHSQDDRAQSEDRGQHALRTVPYVVTDIISRGSIDRSVTNVLTQKKSDARFFVKQLNHEVLQSCP